MCWDQVRSESNEQKERRGKTTKLNVLVWHLNTICDYIIKHNKITKLWWCISKSTLNWKSLWYQTATVSSYFAENLRRYYVVNNSREEKLIKPENLHTWSKNIIKCHKQQSLSLRMFCLNFWLTIKDTPFFSFFDSIFALKQMMYFTHPIMFS